MRTKLLWTSSLLFTAVLVSGRLLLLHERQLLQFNGELLRAIGADVAFGLFIIAIIYTTKKVSRIIPYVLTLPLLLLYLSNMEYIYALSDVINLHDLFYAADGQFLQGTFSHLSFPLYTVLLLASLLFLIWSVDRRKIVFRTYRASRRQLVLYAIVLLAIQTGLTSLMGNNWQTVNFAQASLHNGMNSLFYRDEIKFAEFPGDIEGQIYGNSKLSDGNWLLSPETLMQKNVLVIAMEGIPGAYLGANQDYFGTENSIRLSSLERIKNHSLVVPNFVTHNNQTIRGLYSLLSGDYPKLNASTPEAYEYIRNPQGITMLPQELKARGYHTAYIQAAPLDYMSKDQFMKSAGFDTIIGSEGFTGSIPFGWGVDDGAFFQQIPRYLEELNRREEPWFATLLTVGTHHPYAIPTDLEKQYPDRKEAAVHYLDQSLSSLIDYLETSEVGKETLVIFTSDESHGVTDQPYGSNWGLCLVYSPSIQGQIVNEGLYGLKDIESSVVDLVDGIQDSGHAGLSIFRSYAQQEPILFASHYSGDVFYSEGKGEVIQMDSRNRLYAINSENSKLFSGSYTKTRINDSALKLKISMYKQYLNLPRVDPNEELVIVSDKVYGAGWGEQVSITGGQYLTLPAKTHVEILMDYEFINPAAGEEVTFYLDAEQNPDRMARKTINSSTPGQGTLVYSFYNEEERSSYNFTLRASVFATEGTLKVNRVTVDFPPDEPQMAAGAMEFEVYSENVVN